MTGRAFLTVSQSALFIALGTGNVISNIDPQTYKKDWVVYVTDANGVAVPNITLTIKVLPTRYGKGYLGFVSGDGWGATRPTPCSAPMKTTVAAIQRISTTAFSIQVKTSTGMVRSSRAT